MPIAAGPLPPDGGHRPIVVVMGVSGCGKSTVGAALAERLALRFLEGDALHPPANVARMAAGIALTDDDRAEWLDAIAGQLAEARHRGEGLVVACSALKRRYRDRLRSAAPDLQLVHLSGPAELIARRLSARSGHYMPASLLPSQLSDLEPPAADEAAWSLPLTEPAAELVAQLAERLRPAALQAAEDRRDAPSAGR